MSGSIKGLTGKNFVAIVVVTSSSLHWGMSMERKSFSRVFVDGIASLGEGMASMFSWGFYPQQSLSYEERFGTDAELFASDWQRVGDDMRSAMNQFEKEMGNSFK